MAETEEIGPGRRVVRDVDGRFEKVELDPEVAREMGSKRKGPSAMVDLRDDLLASRGLSPEDDPGLTALAGVAVSGKSGAVSALRYFDVLTGRPAPPRQYEGDTCPTCGRSGQVNLPEFYGNEAIIAVVKDWIETQENESGEHGETMQNVGDL